METAVKGLVCAFKAENGFGVLELEDGREITFDVTACVEEPLEGQAVRVLLGHGRTGEARAVLVEPENVPSSTRPPSSLREVVRRLQSEGLALELDPWEIDAIARDAAVPAELPEHLPLVLSAYYRHEHFGARRRSSDQYVAWFEGREVGTFERELAELLGGGAVTFEAFEVLMSSIDDVVDAFNEELRAQGDARRIVPLEVANGGRGYYCMALSRAMRLSVSGVLRVRWERPHLTPSEPPPRNA